MFSGASFITLDAKGRLSVPARYRGVLTATPAAQVTLTKHPHGCLLMFPQSEWELFAARVAALPMEVQWWKRIFLGNAMELTMDSTGRILVSPELRAGASITREVVLLGMGSHLELWDRDTYLAKEAEAMQGEMPDVFKGFSF